MTLPSKSPRESHVARANLFRLFAGRGALRLSPLQLVLDLLGVGYREAVDAEEVAYARGHEERPAEIDDEREDEVGAEIVLLGAGRDGREAEAWKVAEDGAAHERNQHDGPVREGLARQVREDHLCGHAPEDEGHGQAEEDEVVLAHERRVGRVQPGADGEGVDGHGDPFKEDGEDGESVATAGLDHVEHAEGHVTKDERADDDEDPDVADRVVADELVVAEEVLFADKIDDALGPDAGAVDAREGHDAAGDQYALCRTVKIAEVERVGVVGLPGGEEHGEAGAESGKDARFGGS